MEKLEAIMLRPLDNVQQSQTPLPKFSVVIPTYNRAQLIKNALESVFSQSYKDYEVIVIDDGSTDETKQVLETYGDKIRYYHQQNQGPSAARNTGIKMARGELIAFLDSDDSWFPNKLERQAKFMDDHPDIAMCHGYFDAYTEGIEYPEGYLDYGKKLWDLSHARGPTYENWLLECCCQIQTVVIQKKCFAEVGLFDPELRICEDYDLFLRIAAHYKIGLLKGDLLMRYRLHGGIAVEALNEGYIGVLRKHLQLIETGALPVNRQLSLRNVHLILSKAYYFAGDFSKGRKHFLKACAVSLSAIIVPPYFRFFASSFIPPQLRKGIRAIRKMLFPNELEALGSPTAAAKPK